MLYVIMSQWELEKMTRLEQVGRTRHLIALRERLRHGHENTVAPNDFTKTEKVSKKFLVLVFFFFSSQALYVRQL